MSDEILLLDDDAVTLNFLESVLTGAGFVCRTVSDPEHALAAVRSRREIAIVVCFALGFVPVVYATVRILG